ncbi:MAG: lytic transglycosylase domain-containing protein [Clostridiales bacterium]|nr:lytic transglycosylase domain-containing protein [Clostridiales bacterium]
MVNEANGRRKRGLLPLFILLAVVALEFFLLRAGYRKYMQAVYPVGYTELVHACAEEYGFPPSLIFAVIRTESEFDPSAVSSAGARGLMQMTENTFEWAQRRAAVEQELTSDQLFDPEISVRYGVYVLSLLRERFENTNTLLAAYNAGMGNAAKWLGDSRYSEDGVTLKRIPFEETREYVEKVRDAQSMYQELYKME